MPSVRKLTLDEVRTIERRVKGQRKLIEEEYDGILSEYNEGEYGEAELALTENRITVRNRLKAAAQRRGLSLDFKRTKGNLLRFRVVEGEQATTLSVPEPALSARSRSSGRGRKRA